MQDRRPTAAEETAPLDPVALTLAVWLGLIVGVTGLLRLSENAATQAAIAQNKAILAGKPMTMPASGQPMGDLPHRAALGSQL